jgi:hypothetical protein
MSGLKIRLALNRQHDTRDQLYNSLASSRVSEILFFGVEEIYYIHVSSLLIHFHRCQTPVSPYIIADINIKACSVERGKTLLTVERVSSIKQNHVLDGYRAQNVSLSIEIFFCAVLRQNSSTLRHERQRPANDFVTSFFLRVSIIRG